MGHRGPFAGPRVLEPKAVQQGFCMGKLGIKVVQGVKKALGGEMVQGLVWRHLLLGWQQEEEEEEADMESSMKPVVVEEPPRCCGGCGGCGCGGCGCGCLRGCLCFLPRLLCSLPRKLLGCLHCRCLLLVVLVSLLLAIIVVGFLLMWLRAAPRTEDVSKARGSLAWPWLPMRVQDQAATFYVDSGTGGPATVIYDYEHLLISYRSWRHPACYVTRMDRNNIQGLDAVTAAFERRQAERALSEPLGDRSLLSTAANVLCSVLPVYWA
ncbi:pulmonary surfactant-associated protein C-like [Nothoprocta perdicaria]|uniref:pulmonary surfactant-associated protein C-like n=1 Tax=Nothoprocta perdicaria TaxID=30464 RepID=UPI000E1B6506|nr:pulmonary surfactant-associated protein C-like [Nothoprocta perdicaria]